MDMKKKLIIAVASLLPALAISTAIAGDFNVEGAGAGAPPPPPPMANHNGVSLGMFYDQSVGGMVPKVTYINNWFVGSIGASYSRENPSVGDSYNNYYVPINVGFIRELTPNVSYSMGPGGMWGKTTQNSGDNPYVYGAEAGLYYFATDHLTVSATLMPVAHEKETDGTSKTELFEEGSIGISYAF